MDVLSAAGGMTGRGGGGRMKNWGLGVETGRVSVDKTGRAGRGVLALGDRAGRDSSLGNGGRLGLNWVGLGC